jgi:hypothetical protein
VRGGWCRRRNSDDGTHRGEEELAASDNGGRCGLFYTVRAWRCDDQCPIQPVRRQRWPTLRLTGGPVASPTRE